MLKDAVAVLDIGSYSLTAIIGENGINNNFITRVRHKCNHDAFDGDRINEDRLFNSIKDSVKVLEGSAKARLDQIYVGISGDFLRIFNREYRSFFNRKKRIKDKDITEFFDGAQKDLKTGDYTIITRHSVCFLLDGNLRAEQAIGAVSSSLSGFVTFVGAKTQLIKCLNSIFKSIGISKVTYLPVPIAEGKLLFSDDERRSMQILLDIGYLSGSLTVLSGDGALYHDSFPIGGGHITAYLYDRMKVDFEVAERLKRKINLSIHQNSGNYVIIYGDNQYTFPVADANETTRFVLDRIAECFDKSILNSRVRLPYNASVSLTGDGISYVRGGASYLSGRIEMPVNIVSPKVSYEATPDNSSCLSVLNYALNAKFY